jgi:hypothetical protein
MNILNSAIRSRYVVYGLAIVTTYVVFAVLYINHFVGTLLRGSQYDVYYLAYLPILYLFFCTYGVRPHAFGKIGWSLGFGGLAGYAAGLIAYFAVVFSMGDGLVRIANSATNVTQSLGMLAVPIMHFGWAYGALAAVLVYLFKRLGVNPDANSPPFEVP